MRIENGGRVDPSVLRDGVLTLNNLFVPDVDGLEPTEETFSEEGSVQWTPENHK